MTHKALWIRLGIAVVVLLIGILVLAGSSRASVIEVVGGSLLVLLLVATVITFPALVARLDQAGGSPPEDVVKARNDVRTALLQGFASILLLVGAFVGFIQLRNSQREISTTAESQETDQFSVAVGQLASPNGVDVRLGGIFTLEQLARERSGDRPIVVSLLAEYVQDNAHPSVHAQGASAQTVLPLQLTRPDVQECLNFLTETAGGTGNLSALYLDGAYLPGAAIGGSRGAQLNKVTLRGAQLTNATIVNTQLVAADLSDASLAGSTLTGSSFRDADLAHAQLSNAIITDAQMSGVNLTNASLHGADLGGTSLQGALLVGADLSAVSHIDGDVAGADFRGANLAAADLRDATNLDKADFTGARCDAALTLLPPGPIQCDQGFMHFRTP